MHKISCMNQMKILFSAVRDWTTIWRTRSLKKCKVHQMQSCLESLHQYPVQVIRKTKVNAKSENKPEESYVLQSLCQNYHNDMWWWAVNQARLLMQAIYWRLFLKFLTAKMHESGSYFSSPGLGLLGHFETTLQTHIHLESKQLMFPGWNKDASDLVLTHSMNV